MMKRLLLALLLFLPAPLWGFEVLSGENVEPGDLINIRYELADVVWVIHIHNGIPSRVDMEDVWVVKVRENPLTSLDVREVCEGRLFFSAQPGYYILMGTEDGKKMQKIIRVGPQPEPDPDPDPPGPDPPGPKPPGPDPDIPIPENVTNQYGIGHDLYRKAYALKKPADCKTLGLVLMAAAKRLHEGRMLPNQALDAVGRETPESLKLLMVETADLMAKKANEASSPGQLFWRDMLYEASLALTEVGKQ